MEYEFKIENLDDVKVTRNNISSIRERLEWLQAISDLPKIIKSKIVFELLIEAKTDDHKEVLSKLEATGNFKDFTAIVTNSEGEKIRIPETPLTDYEREINQLDEYLKLLSDPDIIEGKNTFSTLLIDSIIESLVRLNNLRQGLISLNNRLEKERKEGNHEES